MGVAYTLESIRKYKIAKIKPQKSLFTQFAKILPYENFAPYSTTVLLYKFFAKQQKENKN